MRRIMPILLASAISFYSGMAHYRTFDSLFNSRKYTDAPALELVYSKNDLGKTDITLINQKNAKRYPVQWGNNGLRVGSLEHRLQCIASEVKDKNAARVYAKPLLSASREIRRRVYESVLGGRFAEDSYTQDFLDIDIAHRINDKGNVETYVTNGSEAFPLTADMQMGGLDYRMKGLISESTRDNGILYNMMKGNLVGWLDKKFEENGGRFYRINVDDVDMTGKMQANDVLKIKENDSSQIRNHSGQARNIPRGVSYEQK